MAEQPTGKLAVILHADVVGSTELVQRDERRAHERITGAFQRLSQTSRAYGGAVHEIRGDALVADFTRASDAVCAALAFQQDNTAHNKSFDDEIIPEIRVGISLGEVVVADNTVTGAGVVLAQRVEQLAEPGGVCITEAIREALPDRLPLDHQNLGEQALKGFEQLAHVHAVRLQSGAEVPPPEPQHAVKRQRKVMVATAMTAAGLVLAMIAVGWLKPWQPDTEPASMDRMAHSLPDKPSIAVLPFDNLSGDPEQDYLAGGMTEEVVTTLSRVPNLFVIADSSTDIYKGKAVAAKQVAEEHGVRYVLQGSMQRAGDRVRINVQLVDALEGNHVWAERYDREFQDLFALQDDITRNIALAIQGELTEGDLVWRRAEGLDPEALHLMYKARTVTDKIDRENIARGRKILLDAQSISPDALFPLAMLGWMDAYEARYGWSPSRESSLQEAEAKAREVLARDETYPEALMLLGYIHVMRDLPDDAIRYYQNAVDANPNHARAAGGLGWNLAYAGRPTEAISSLKKAMRLSPYHPGWMDTTLGLAYMMTGEYDKAIQGFKDSLAKDELVLFSHERLAATYALKGDLENARLHAATVLEIKPDFSIEGWSKVLKYKRKEDLDRELNALRKAGLPEKPPLALPDKPSIAVLPFSNMSGDPEQEYFVDGMTEDLITDLSKISDLIVISRTSSFSYKGQSPDIRTVAEDLGVSHVVEGSVRKVGNQVRISAQLINATTGAHVWADRFDRQLEDIFALQDEVRSKIIAALAVKLTPEEKSRLARPLTKSVEAYELYLKALQQTSFFGREANLTSQEMLKQAIELDSEFAAAYSLLAQAYSLAVENEWTDNRDELIKLAVATAEKGIEIDPELPFAHWSLARVYSRSYLGDLDGSLEAFEKSVALDPNYADGYVMLASTQIKLGQAEKALGNIEQGMRINPHFPFWYTFTLGQAQFALTHYEAAEESFKKAIERNPSVGWSRRWLVATYGHLGKLDDAEWEISELESLGQPLTIEKWKLAPGLDPEYAKRLFEGARKAGVPES